MQVINDLIGYKNLKIYQDTEMFNFSLDSVLLPNFITINKKTEKILDIGTGNAPIPLILTKKTNANIIGIEIQKEAANLAEESVKLNNKQNQIKIINEDIKNYSQNHQPNDFDIITCNPPFFKVNQNSNLNKNNYKTIARHETNLNLDDICKISKKLLKNNGVLGLVHRPERLADIIITMKKYNIEPKKIRLVYPSPRKRANILLIEGRLNGNPGIKIEPPLISHENNGDYTKEIKKYFE